MLQILENECGAVAGRSATWSGIRPSGNRRRDFLRNDSGATAIEFGVLAIPFFMIIGAILETSLIFLSGHILDTAVHDAGRLVRTGRAESMDVAKFKKIICDDTFGLFGDCEGLHLEVDVFNTFSQVAITPPINMPACAISADDCGWDPSRPEKYSGGQSTSIVVVQVYYKWQTLPGLGGFSLSNLKDGTRLMSSSTVFRNEPF